MIYIFVDAEQFSSSIKSWTIFMKISVISEWFLAVYPSLTMFFNASYLRKTSFLETDIPKNGSYLLKYVSNQ